ncbi:MAG: dihydroorotate dehydrogenase electron transfer subunit [Solirubrobacterales bacterium]
MAELEPGIAAAQPGPRTPAPLGRRACPVTLSEPVGRYRMIGLEDRGGPTPLPGQFYMLACADGWGSDLGGERPYLPRAFSVCRVRGARLDFLIDVVGPGTERLASMALGERAWALGPLGIGFTAPDGVESSAPGARALLVGGGIGIAPLVIWNEALAGNVSNVALGFRDEEFAAAASLLGANVSLATDDGSVGHAGLVTDLLSEQLERNSDRNSDRNSAVVVYACGPPAMLDAIRRICTERGVPAQLALEQAMACGYGACFGCVVRTRDGYRRLCVDGPIVAASDLHEEWQ